MKSYFLNHSMKRMGTFLPLSAALLLAGLSSVWNAHLFITHGVSPLQKHLDDFVSDSQNNVSYVTDDDKKPGSPHYLLQEPTHHACDGYRGVLHIASGDQGAAAGTAFFQYVINQLIWADMYNMLPWIHFNNISQNVYDPVVHGGVNTTLQIQSGMSIGWRQAYPRASPKSGEDGAYPGLPHATRRDALVPANYTVNGNGVWESYFEPVSDFRKGDKSCEAKPLVSMTYPHLTPGINYYAPWAVRSWQYEYIPQKYKLKENQTRHEWFEPMRIKAHQIVTKYYRFQPHILEAVDKLLPKDQACLGVHIRHSDKWGLARRQIPEEEFLPFMRSFVRNGGSCIYLATDDQELIPKTRKWDQTIVQRIVTQGDNVVRSTYANPVFRQEAHHRTNTEVLIDLVALSKCKFMIHGFSAVSESAIYLNLDLHNQSVDLEDPSHLSPDAFGALVKRVLKEKKES